MTQFFFQMLSPTQSDATVSKIASETNILNYAMSLNIHNSITLQF